MEADVLVRLTWEHEVLRGGQRVTLPAGSTVEVSEHTLRAFADRMELVEGASSPQPADDNAGGQEETTASGPQLVQGDDEGAEKEQSQEGAGGEASEEVSEEVEVEAKAEPKEEHQRPAYEIATKPGGWYGIMVGGEELASVRKDDIPAKLAELGLAE